MMAIGTAQGETSPPLNAKFIVKILAKASENWIASALEQNVYHDLAAYPRLVAFDDPTVFTRRCKTNEMNCILTVLDETGVSILFLGELKDSRLKFELFDVPTKRRVTEKSLTIGPGKLETVRLLNFRAIRPFIEPGGILDQRDALKTTKTQDPVLNDFFEALQGALSDNRYELQMGALLVFLFISLFPFLLTVLLKIGQPRAARQRIRTLRLTLVITYLTLGLFLWLWVREVPFDLGFDLGNLPVYLAGGILWAIFLRYTLSFSFQSIFGIDRVQSETLFSLLLSWASMTSFRIFCVLFLCLPFFVFILFSGVLFGCSPLVTLLILIPVLGAVFLFWFFYVAETFSYYLDGENVIGDALETNPWHGRIEKYLVDYGLRFQTVVHTDHVLFLPGRNSGIIVYGGGVSRPRIVIDETILITSLGLKLESPDQPNNSTSTITIPWQSGDLLFGALLHGLGKIHLKEHIISSFILTLENLKWTAPGPFKSIIRLMVLPYHSFIEPVAHSLADSYAAMNGGLHHLIQYLVYQLNHRSDFLTVEAEFPLLIATTHRILSSNLQGPSAKAPFQHRILNLSNYVRERGFLPPERSGFILIPLFAGALALVVFLKMLGSSISYHDTYVERIHNLKRKIKEIQHEEVIKNRF